MCSYVVESTLSQSVLPGCHEHVPATGQQHALTYLGGSSVIELPDREGMFSGSRWYDSCVIELPDREGAFSRSQEKPS